MLVFQVENSTTTELLFTKQELYEKKGNLKKNYTPKNTFPLFTKWKFIYRKEKESLYDRWVP